MTIAFKDTKRQILFFLQDIKNDSNFGLLANLK